MKAPRHIMVAGSEGRREDHKAGPQRGSGKVGCLWPERQAGWGPQGPESSRGVF